MQPRLEILPEAQQRLWPLLREVPGHFVLYGGTAIAMSYFEDASLKRLDEKNRGKLRAAAIAVEAIEPSDLASRRLSD